MRFETKDLMVTLNAVKEEGNGWEFMIGCGPASVECDNTQKPPRPYKRLDPVNIESGLKTDDDLEALRYELQKRLDEIDQEFLKRGITKKLLQGGGGSEGASTIPAAKSADKSSSE